MDLKMDSEIITSDMGNLLEITRVTALNVNSLSEQMGVNTRAIAALNGKVDDMGERMNTYEDNLYITPQQADNIHSAVVRRVFEVLKIETDECGHVIDDCLDDYVLYFNRFIGKCYSDAKKFGHMGSRYQYTIRRDYDTCINYVEAWIPRGGIQSYKQYLDACREKSMSLNK